MSYTLTCGKAAAGDFASMAAAMASAGVPADRWTVSFGCPDLILARPAGTGSGQWRIEAPGVAHELVELVCATDCCRAWSAADTVIIDVAVGYLADGYAGLPVTDAWRAAARIAGHYAAAGEVPQSKLAAAILAASGGSWPDGAAALIVAELTGLLRAADVTVYDDRPADDLLRDLAARRAGPYQLRPARPGPAGGAAAGQYGSLSQAMAAAGFPVLAAWRPDPRDPGRLLLAAGRTGTGQPGPALEAPGIARQFAEVCPDELRVSRQWSAADTRIRDAVLEQAGAAGPWRLPRQAALRAAAWLAAFHATGGLSASSLFAVLAEAYGRVGMVPPADVADGIAAAITRRLAAAGIAVTGSGISAGRRPAAARLARAGLEELYWRIWAPLAVRSAEAAAGWLPGWLRRSWRGLAAMAAVVVIVAAALRPGLGPAGHSWVFWVLISATAPPPGRPLSPSWPRRRRGHQ